MFSNNYNELKKVAYMQNFTQSGHFAGPEGGSIQCDETLWLWLHDCAVLIRHKVLSVLSGY